MPKILLIQGPNMSYLGRRQPEIYGTTSAVELDAMLRAHARANGYQLDIFYTHVLYARRGSRRSSDSTGRWTRGWTAW